MDDDKLHFRLGSAVDCLLTTPETWNDTFASITVSRPSGYMPTFIGALPKGLKATSNKELYREAYEKAGYRMNIDTVISRLWGIPENNEFYEAISSIKEGMVVLSKDELEQVTKIVECLRGNPFVHPYFYKTNVAHEIHKQVAIYFEYEDLECKALLDGYLINHDTKEIIPYDLKTTSKSVYAFEEAYLQWGYYRQCSFYELALKSKQSPIKELLDDGYTLQDYLFIVAETKPTSSSPAIIYQTSFYDRRRGLDGGYVGKRYYPGINNLISDYKWHLKEDNWEMPPQLWTSKGVRQLRVFESHSECET